MKTKLAFGALTLALVLATILLAACAQPEPTQTEAPSDADGATLLEERCTTCHDLDQVTQIQQTRDEWEQTVTRMIDKGAQLNQDEQDILIEYLAETYGP